MKCKDCAKFSPSAGIEAGAEIFPNVRSINGTCCVSNRLCRASDRCSCGGFEKKR